MLHIGRGCGRRRGHGRRRRNRRRRRAGRGAGRRRRQGDHIVAKKRPRGSALRPCRRSFPAYAPAETRARPSAFADRICRPRPRPDSPNRKAAAASAARRRPPARASECARRGAPRPFPPPSRPAASHAASAAVASACAESGSASSRAAPKAARYRLFMFLPPSEKLLIKRNDPSCLFRAYESR